MSKLQWDKQPIRDFFHREKQPFVIVGIVIGILAFVTVTGGAQEPIRESREEKPETQAGRESEAIAGINRFAIDLYRTLGGVGGPGRSDGGTGGDPPGGGPGDAEAGDTEKGSASTDPSSQGNLLFSPYSISSALTMLYSGARGETASQMAGTLHLPSDVSAVHRSLGELTRSLSSMYDEETFELTIANALWGHEGSSIRESFAEVNSTYYEAGLRLLPFAPDPEGARTTINSWVEKKTNGRITNLLPRGTVNERTRLVVTNAIYFLGKWAIPFEKKRTEDTVFYADAGYEIGAHKTLVPTMHQSDRFGYAEVPGAQILKMPYEGRRISMIVILPEEIAGLPSLESKLTFDVLDRWIKSAQNVRQVEVSLPRFGITWSGAIKNELMAMGMNDVFVPGRADLSGIDGTRRLFLNDVVHKAFIEVDETGTEAAAATGGVVGITSIRPERPARFVADHPFLFLIRDDTSGSILFLGRVVRLDGPEDY